LPGGWFKRGAHTSLVCTGTPSENVGSSVNASGASIVNPELSFVGNSPKKGPVTTILQCNEKHHLASLKQPENDKETK
jgi:hypothetical protein